MKPQKLFRFKLLALFIVCTVPFIHDTQASCKSEYDLAIASFEKRGTGAKDWHAQSKYIDLTIKHLEKSIKCKEYRIESAHLLMRSYHFKSMFTDISVEEKKDFFNKAKVLGDSMMKKYPMDPEIKLWWVINSGKWIEYHGILRAAYEGIGPKLKRTCEDVIEIDSTLVDGVGLRILGTIYYKAPYLPFFLTWPNKKQGLRMSYRALKIGPNNIGNLMFLGRLLFFEEEYEKSRKYLEKCLAQKPREEYLFIDRYDQWKARTFLQKIKNGETD